MVVGEVGKVSLDKTLAHLGFHAHPTKTPTRTAIQRGDMNINNSLNTSTIVGRCKISNKTETKAIFEQIQEDPDGQSLETIRKTLGLIGLVSVKAQRLLEGLIKEREREPKPSCI